MLYVLRRGIIVFPPAGHGGAIGPPAPGGASRPALRAGSVAGVPRPASGTALLHTGPLVGASFADLHATLPACGSRACRAGRRSAGPVGSRSQRLARNTCSRRALPRRVAARSRSLSDDSPKLIVAPKRVGEGNAAARLHIAATRPGLGLDSVVTRDLTGEAGLTERDIRANRPTIDNIDCGTATRCCRRSGSCRRSVPTTTSSRWTTTATGSTATTVRCLLSPRELNSLRSHAHVHQRAAHVHARDGTSRSGR